MRLLRVRRQEKVLLSDWPAVSYIRVAPTTDEAAREVEDQRAQIALVADRLGLRMADEFVDVATRG